MKTTRFFLTMLLMGTALGLARGETLALAPEANWIYREDLADDEEAQSFIVIQFSNKGGSFREVVMQPDKEGIAQLNRLRLTMPSKADFAPVLLRLRPQDGATIRLPLDVLSAKAPDAKAKYVIRLGPNFWEHMHLATKLAAGEKLERPREIEVTVLKEEREKAGFRTTNTLKTKVEGLDDLFSKVLLEPNNFLSLLSGAAGKALLSGKVGLAYDLPKSPEFHLHLDTTADVDLSGLKDKKFFNSVAANFMAARDLWGINRIGVTAKVETDQGFQNVNATAGVALRLYQPNPITSNLANWLRTYVWPEPREGEALRAIAPAPKITLGYDFVGKVARGTGEDARRTATGEHRLSADLYWTLWLFRGIRLKDYPPFGFDYRLGLVFDVAMKYDLEKSKFLPEQQFSLIFMPEGNPKKPNPEGFAFTLTYANGKATPTFKHVNSLLVGLGYRF